MAVQGLWRMCISEGIFNKHTFENRILFNMFHNLHDSQTVVIFLTPNCNFRTSTMQCLGKWCGLEWRETQLVELWMSSWYRINMIWWLIHIPLKLHRTGIFPYINCWIWWVSCINYFSIHGAFGYIILKQKHMLKLTYNIAPKRLFSLQPLCFKV